MPFDNFFKGMVIQVQNCINIYVDTQMFLSNRNFQFYNSFIYQRRRLLDLLWLKTVEFTRQQQSTMIYRANDLFLEKDPTTTPTSTFKLPQ